MLNPVYRRPLHILRCADKIPNDLFCDCNGLCGCLHGCCCSSLFGCLSGCLCGSLYCFLPGHLYGCLISCICCSLCHHQHHHHNTWSLYFETTKNARDGRVHILQRENKLCIYTINIDFCIINPIGDILLSHPEGRPLHESNHKKPL